MTVLVPLRRRLLLLIAAGLLPLAIMSAVALFALFKAQGEQAERAALEITRALSTAVDAELQRSIAALEGIAVGPALDMKDFERYHGVMRRVLAGRPEWVTVTLADPQGQQLLNTRLPAGSALPAVLDPDTLQKAVAARRPVVGSLERSPRGDIAVPVRVPVVRDGAVRFVLTAALKPEGFLDVLMRQKVPSDWVVSVFDQRLQRVARSRLHAESLGGGPSPTLRQMIERAGDEGSGVTEALEGDRIYTAFSRSPRSGYVVAIGIPAGYVEAGAWRSLAVYGSGVALSLFLGILAAALVGRRIIRPIEELGAAAQALGRRAPVAPPGTDIQEIHQVAASLALAAEERARDEAEREQLLAREQQARAIAEEANRSKDEFLAMLGHELRNPLGAISNASQLLELGDDEARMHARGVIARQVQHLARMTDDLLDAARAMTGKIVLQRQPLDLAEAATRAVSTIRSGGRAGRRTFLLRASAVWVDADPTRIEQIVGNLLGNSIKFTPDNGAITIFVAREGDEAVLRVADDGIGMVPELAARVFEPFVQGERPLDRSQGGLGIGLTLVRRLAELHGGSAAAASKGPGRGSEFTVRLPAIEKPAMSLKKAKEPSAAVSRDVLIVEDNPDARETLRRMLELDGHRVRVAPDGLSALEVARESMPEVALIDLGLPQMDGYELAREIRRLDGARRPYLVAVTGYGLPDDRARTRAAGFDLHLTKPVDAEDLADVLKR